MNFVEHVVRASALDWQRTSLTYSAGSEVGAIAPRVRWMITFTAGRRPLGSNLSIQDRRIVIEGSEVIEFPVRDC
jgi:hypothetical protein